MERALRHTRHRRLLSSASAVPGQQPVPRPTTGVAAATRVTTAHRSALAPASSWPITASSPAAAATHVGSAARPQLKPCMRGRWQHARRARRGERHDAAASCLKQGRRSRTQQEQPLQRPARRCERPVERKRQRPQRPVRLRQLCRQRSSRRRQERTGSAPAACSGTAPPRCGAGAGGGAVAAAKGGNSEGGGQVEGG